MKLIEFIFQSFWTFIGTIFIIALIFEGIQRIIESIKEKS